MGTQIQLEDAGLDSLRRHVRAAEDKNMLPTASFFGEKIICLPGAKDSDLYKLAQIYYKQRQYKRALQTLQKAQCASSDKNFRLLSGQCLAESKEYEQCLGVLGDDDIQQMLPEDSPSSLSGADEVDTMAAICLLRARVYDMQQNRVKAAFWYQEAIRRDVKCYEAFEKLVESHMLSAEEESALLASLRFREDELWLKGMYRGRLHKYDVSVVQPLSLSAEDDIMDHNGGAVQAAEAAETRVRALDRARAIFANSVDAKTIMAEFHYYHNDFVRCHEVTEAILARDSFAHPCLDSAEAWYAVGCYYYLTQKFEKARVNFLKATTLNPYFAPAWLGYGHTFAAQDESDQALAAYRTAARFFSGCHVPPLCIGMEYAKTGNLQVSDQFFSHTLSICAMDPLVFNEIGVLRYLQGNYEEAAEAFEKVIDLSKVQLVNHNISETGEASLFNLGHCYRKLQRLDDAIEMYKRALRCSPNKASTYTALAFTYHLMSDYDSAINYYHKALGLSPDDTLTTEMLERALKNAADNSGL